MLIQSNENTSASVCHAWVYGLTPAGNCVDICGLCYYWGPFRYLWSLLSPDTMLMSVGHAAVGNNVEVGDLHCHLRSCWCPRAATRDHISVLDSFCPRDFINALGLYTTKGHDGYYGVCGLFYGRDPTWCLWSILPVETMLRSVAYANSGDHAEIHDLCFHWL